VKTARLKNASRASTLCARIADTMLFNASILNLLREGKG
jgi:hypothetical protein